MPVQPCMEGSSFFKEIVKWSSAFVLDLFSQKAQSQMFDGAFNMPKLMMVNSANFKNWYVAS